jgi:sugar phosphate isomerase/epimerase
VRTPAFRLGVSANWLAHARALDSRNAWRVLLAEAAACREDGFDFLEAPVPHLESSFARLGLSFWREVGEAMRGMGVPAHSVHGPTFPGLDVPERLARRRLATYARIVGALGARVLVVHPVHHTHLHVCRVTGPALARDAALARHLGEELAGTSAALAIENVPHNSWAYLEELFRRVRHPKVRFCLDTGHLLVRPERPLAEVVAKFGARTAFVHCSDNDGLCDAHRAPGSGRFPWKDLAGAVARGALPPELLVELAAPILREDPRALAATRRGYRAAARQARRLFQRLLQPGQHQPRPGR